MKGLFTTGKRLTHPTWKYKTRMSYLLAKERQLSESLKALYKVGGGSAWMPKKIRELVYAAQEALEKAYTEQYKFNQRLKKRLKKS